MDVPTTLFLMIVAGVLIPPIRKLLDLVYRQCSLHIRNIRERRSLQIANANSVNEAIECALKAWHYVEFEFEEKMIKQAKAYGGYFPTTQDKIRQWEFVVAKCNEAAFSLERIKRTKEAEQWKNNATIAARKIDELGKHPDTSTTFVVGICEATRRELEREGRDGNHSQLANSCGQHGGW